MRHRPQSTPCACALALLLLAGCSEYPTYAEHAAESIDTVAMEAMFVVAAMEGMTPLTTPEEAAQNAASQADRFFSEGCFTTSLDGPAVTYQMVDCEGPFGYSGITGMATVTYRDTMPGVGFDVITQGLTIGGSDARFTTSGEISSDVRSVQITTMAEVVGPRGILLARDGSYTLRWGQTTQCAAVDGSFTTTVQSNVWETTVSEWQTCPSDCPSMGGMVTFTNADLGTITVSYDGSTKASWNASEDGSGEVTLICPGLEA